jgi:putative ABC transport system ATP-binding protein
MLLAIDGLSCSYVDHVVLDDFSLALDRGQHSLLLGPSGSGKTTLINMIAGLLTATSGTILIAGEAMTVASTTARDDLRRRRIGIIFQTLRLVSALDLRANLELAQKLSGHGRDKALIDSLLERLGIAHRAHAQPRELSQGEAQRAAIARALVGKPDLLIADEPTSALDDANMDRVGRLLVETADVNGSTLLIATHDQRLRALVQNTVALSALKLAA